MDRSHAARALVKAPAAWGLVLCLGAHAVVADPVGAPADEAPSDSEPADPPRVDALSLWDDNGNGGITCAEARRHGIAPVRSGHPAYPYMRDPDNDGVVCERD